MKSILTTLVLSIFCCPGFAMYGTYEAIDAYNPTLCHGPYCPYATNCDCTDPYCKSMDRSCLSKCDCCAAFGNVGAR